MRTNSKEMKETTQEKQNIRLKRIKHKRDEKNGGKKTKTIRGQLILYGCWVIRSLEDWECC